MTRSHDVTALRFATATAVFTLLLVAAAVLPWATFRASTIYEGRELVQEIRVTGLTGPLGMAGLLIMGLGGMATIAAAMVVFTRGRGWGFSAGRWLGYAAGLAALAIYFLSRAWVFEKYQATARQTGDAVYLVKQANEVGLVTALVLAAAALLVASAGSYVSWRRARAYDPKL